jgi:hypothetical protein
MTWMGFFAAIGVVTVSTVILAVILIWAMPDSVKEMKE